MVPRTPPRHALHGPANPRHPPGLAGQLAAARGASDGVCVCPLRPCRAGHRLALAVGPGDDPLGRQGALPAADPVPGAKPGARRLAGLGALRVQRTPADRRPAGDDLLAAVPGAGARRRRAQPVGGGCHRARHGVPRRCSPDAVVPRPGLALGGRADRRARLQLRGVDGLAHSAHRPGAEPRLSGRRACVPGPGAGAGLDPLRRGRGRRRRLHGAGARPGGAARHLSPGEPCGLAPADGGRAARCAACKRTAARRRRDLRRSSHRHTGHADGPAGAGVRTAPRSITSAPRAARCTPRCC